MPTQTSEEIDQLIRTVYERFNARDIDGVLELLRSDVEWANGVEGGFIQGHEALREYWTQQWKLIDPQVEPTAIDIAPDGRVVVSVAQTARDLDGEVIVDGLLAHIYTLVDGQIARMEIVE